MATIQDSRILSKSSTVASQAPTVPASNDHTDGTWLVTDIYKGEIFINQIDNKVYTRTDSGIIEIGATIDLSGYIKRDGTSTATTGNIQIGSTKGIEWDANSYLVGTATYIASTVTDGADLSTVINQSDSAASMTSSDGGTSAVAQILVTYGSGVGVKTSDYYAYLKTDNLTADRTGQLQDSNGTFAWLTDLDAIVVSSNTTASNNKSYNIVASATFTDPSPVAGFGFTVFVRNGTATVGGTAYATAGTVIRRVFHSGAWANYAYSDNTAFLSLTGGTLTGALGLPVGALSTPSLFYSAQPATGVWFASQTVNFSVDNGVGVGSNILKLAFNGATFNKDILPVNTGTLNIGSTTAEWLTIYPRNISRAPRSGTNLNGQVLSYYAQAGTGNGSTSTAVHDFYCPTPTASGSTVQTLVKKFTVSEEGIACTAGVTMAYVAKTSAYTITNLDYTIDCTSGTFNVTLPTAVGITGKVFVITNTGGGAITLATTSSQTINGVTTRVVTKGVTVQSNGSNWVVLSSF